MRSPRSAATWRSVAGGPKRRARRAYTVAASTPRRLQASRGRSAATDRRSRRRGREESCRPGSPAGPRPDLAWHVAAVRRSLAGGDSQLVRRARVVLTWDVSDRVGHVTTAADSSGRELDAANDRQRATVRRNRDSDYGQRIVTARREVLPSAEFARSRRVRDAAPDRGSPLDGPARGRSRPASRPGSRHCGLPSGQPERHIGADALHPDSRRATVER